MADVIGTSSGDTLLGTLGDDTISALEGNDLIEGSQGTDTVDGGANYDTLSFKLSVTDRFTAVTGPTTYTVTTGHLTDSSGLINTSFSNVERVWINTIGTGDYNDVIDASGYTSANLGFGALRLSLGNGNNMVTGSGMSDWINVGTGSNVVDAGAGYDEVRFTFVNTTGSTLLVTGAGGTVTTSIDGATNTITNAELIGLIGATFVNGTTTMDASGLTGFGGQLVFYDNDGVNIDIGSPGSDIFANVTGATTGADIYTGNGGADVYDYTFAIDAMNGDIITDFDADDTIDLSFNNHEAGGSPLLANHFIGSAAFSGVAGEYRYVAANGQTLLEVDTDGDGVGDHTLNITNGAFRLVETAPGSNVLKLGGAILGGTAGDDFLQGTIGDDSITAFDGNDTIAATTGHDVVDGGNGYDNLNIRMSFADRFPAATGPQTYTVTTGHIQNSSGTLNTDFTNIERVWLDTRSTGNFNDTIDASGFTSANLGFGALHVTLGNGNNNLVGSGMSDWVNAGTGSNTIDAGSGYDEVYVNFVNTTGSTLFVTGSGGVVQTSIDGVVNTIRNAEQVGVIGSTLTVPTTTVDASGLTGYAGHFVFYDNNGVNIDIGSAGSDIFANVTGATTGADVYTGNGGADVYDYTYAIDAMNGDTITDLDLDDVIDLSHNNLEAGGSPLVANHFIGNAAFSGTVGEYRYVVSGGTTVVEVDTDGDGIGDHSLNISNGAFRLVETAPGSNILRIDGALIEGTSNGEFLIGTKGNDVLNGLGGNDTFGATQGHDVVTGGADFDNLNIRMSFADRFTLATGARTYTIDANNIHDSSGTLNTDFSNIDRVWLDTVGNGNFNDTVDASAYTSTTNYGALRLTLGNGNNNVIGSGKSDWITVGTGSNIIDAGDGYDEVRLNFVNTTGATLVVSGNNGTVQTTLGTSVNSVTNAEWIGLIGSTFANGTTKIDASALTGFTGQLVFYDNNGVNIDIGSAGSDVFANVTGATTGGDVYTGNGGADVYDYTYAVDAMNGDRITDFDADDVIDLRFNNLETGGSPLLANHFIGAAAFSGVAGEYRYQISGNQTLVQVDTNGDKVVDQTLTISNGAFQLVETAQGSNILKLSAATQTITGVVADGYLAGATLFIDSNGNGLLDSGEAWVKTDAQGKFSLSVSQAGTLVAVGGTNIDTGLTNTMTLSAPVGSAVLNPLTTLVQALVDAGGGSVTVAEAQGQVLSALGLDSSLHLTSTDLIAASATSSAALDAQKAAASIANLVTAVESASSATSGSEAALIDALATKIASTTTGTVSLTDSSTVTQLVSTALPGSSEVQSITTQAVTTNQAIAAATSVDGIAVVQQTAQVVADHDFNGDHRSDVALLGTDGSLTVWQASANGGFVANTALAANALGTTWKIAGQGDFNGDGRDDILWRHSSGEIGEWLGQTGVFTNNGGAAANPVDNSWKIVGIADYNGDGRDDILWRHTSGEIGQWLSQPNGGFSNNGGAAANVVDNSWTVLASGDFNGDGKADILWQHTSGVYAEWRGTATGALVNAGAVLTGASGKVVGSGDFNGDGRDDLLMRNAATGQITEWLGQADGSFTAVTPVRQLGDLSWKIASIGDFNGDGHADLLWQHSSGVTAYWTGSATGEFDYGGAGLTVSGSQAIASPDIFLV